jgi:hypothetical protein
MRAHRLAAVGVVLLLADLLCAADLSRLRQPEPKVPASIAHSAKYCLLAFGPEARTRVWLAWDGSALYADRTGDGDLTRPGACITGKKWNEQDSDPDNWLVFDLGDVRDGDRLHRDVSVQIAGLKRFDTTEGASAILTRDAKARAFQIVASVQIAGFHGARSDGQLTQVAGFSDPTGILQFAARPEDSPVIHFGGPWVIALAQKPTLRINRPIDVYLALTTPGLGPGTEVLTGYEGVVPKQLHPKAEFTFSRANVNIDGIEGIQSTLFSHLAALLH